MADSNTEGDQQVTFNIKSSSDAKYALTLPASTTVGDLKQKLSGSEYANVPPESQRLIYSGRVLKDGDTLGSYKIKDGNTVHLVKSAPSNQRQAPANQGGSAVPPGAGQPASNVPSNIAAGTGAGNPLAQLTGARYAGFHGLPGADMFGADGGMGAPPNPDQMLRLLEDPNFAQQMNEAMNNPAVLDMLRNNPMIRNNPMARAAIENPEMRRMMFNPDMIRMQMNMQRAMGGNGAGGEGAFPMPGQTDTTPAGEGANAESNTATSGTQGQTGSQAPPANPFAALFSGGGGGAPGANAGGAGENANTSAQPNPFGSLFGGAQNQSGDQQNPFAQSMQQLAQNPELMQQMMQAFGGGGQGGQAGQGGFNPFGALGGMGGFGGSPEPQGPPDNRPPEERYAEQLRQLNDMGFYEFERNVTALRRSGGSVQGAVEYLLTNP
ncbi:Ubiquitin domain-containing protein DSK2 [Pseudocercospora fuligena]|uniref:Ubiquitin domain-containing protein DSK2 n=1 Tax=Pseudocercospora fuligena TaxID=685502 RepID=A0A8H6RCD7_9PEZI|nr:Ubiquitin domain-containing protein DSK2 [Pseudocercospora fuligena]